MHNPAVNWSEGMFLRPHHFQAADRYWSEVAGLHSQFDHPYGYGVQRITLSEDALTNGVLEIVGLAARFRDGSIVSQASNQRLTVDLKTRLNLAAIGTTPVIAYLAIPQLFDGRENVATKSGESLTRFVEMRRELDEETSGGNRQEVSLRDLNIRILFSTEDLAGFEIVPLVRLVRSSVDGPGFRVDPNYFPPSITLQSWGDLATIVREIRNFIGARIKIMGSLVENKGITLSSQVHGDFEKILLMNAMNEAYGELSCLAFASGVHPLTAYTALCSIVGRCSVFGGANMSVVEPLMYDHDDLETIFRWATDEIRRLINSVKDDECVQRPFIGAGKGMYVSLEAEWFSNEWDWYFGVNPININVEECVQVLKELDWKLGASDKVEQYMTERQPGIRLRSVQQLPRGLTNRGKWIFLQIRLEDEAWKHVQFTQTMAMRVRTEQISNLDSLEGSRKLHVSVRGQPYSLEFAIFAVRKRM